MSTASTETSTTFELDESAAAMFSTMLSDEGVMRAGFVIHESNNFHTPVDPETPAV
jgi:hypothetical protein